MRIVQDNLRIVYCITFDYGVFLHSTINYKQIQNEIRSNTSKS